jgi:molybdenum cofactor cytidylyltransferase
MSTSTQPDWLPAMVLAAGLSARMGKFKPLMMLEDRPLLEHVLHSLKHSGVIGQIVVVTGHRHAEVDAAVLGRAGVRSVFNERYALGEMVSSIKTGIAALGNLEGTRGFVLAFADQPAVLSETIGALVRAFLAGNAPLAIPLYQGRRGHPIVLSALLAPEVLGLRASETLRTIVHRHLDRAAIVPVDDPWVLEDLDTPADVARARARYAAPPASDTHENV